MINNNLWEDSLQGTSYEEISGFAAKVPKVLTDVSTADAEGVTRDAGLLLTKKQIIDLRKYEAAGLALPYTLQDVIDYLRYGAGEDGGAGLKANDFLKTFSETRDHAKRWSPLRERIMLTGSELKLFGASMAIYGADMEEIYAEVKASSLLEKHNIKTLEDLKNAQLELGGKFPGIELESDTIPELKYYLKKIFDRVALNLESVKYIKGDLDKFGYDLRENVLPGIKLKVGLIQSNSYPAEVKALDENISRRADIVEEKNKQYKALVEKSLGAAAGLNIFGLGMAIYYGVEAENVRAERKKLNEEQDKDIDTLKNKNQTLGSLKRVQHDLQNLTVITIDADLATQNLMHVWNVLHRYVSESDAAISNIHDALSLRRFMTAFREVVNPWVQIQQDADALIEVFKDADREYGRTNRATRVNIMSMMNAGDELYPQLDLKVLRQSNDGMRKYGIDAEVLYIKTDYLPALFDRFQRLLADVNASARDLRECSLNSKIDLEAKVRRLVLLEKELAEATIDSEEFEEVREDLELALKRALDITRKEAARLGTHLANISDEYDQSVKLGYIPGLEKDQADAQAVKELLGAKLVGRQEELKAVNDAISILEKSAIDNIGKEIGLTIDNLKSLGLAPPQVQVVMFVIDQLKKAIGDISAGISFLDTIQQSKKLQSKVDDLLKQITEEDKKIGKSKEKLEFILAIHALDDRRRVYVPEYRKAVETFDRFLARALTNKVDSVERRSAAFTKEAREFIAFLTPVSRP